VTMNALDQMHSRKAFVVIVTNCLEKIEGGLVKAQKKFDNEREKALHEFEKELASDRAKL